MTPAEMAEKITERYRDGYRASKWVNGFGEFIALIGFCLGGGIYLLSVLAEKMLASFPAVTSFLKDSFQLSVSDQRSILLVVGVVVGVAVFFVFAAIGTMVSAVGQIAKAVIDTAVNTSPFLSTEQKADVMTATWWTILKRAFKGG
jgi:hypothetical protein